MLGIHADPAACASSASVGSTRQCRRKDHDRELPGCRSRPAARGPPPSRQGRRSAARRSGRDVPQPYARPDQTSPSRESCPERRRGRPPTGAGSSRWSGERPRPAAPGPQHVVVVRPCAIESKIASPVAGSPHPPQLIGSPRFACGSSRRTLPNSSLPGSRGPLPREYQRHVLALLRQPLEIGERFLRRRGADHSVVARVAVAELR